MSNGEFRSIEKHYGFYSELHEAIVCAKHRGLVCRGLECKGPVCKEKIYINNARLLVPVSQCVPVKIMTLDAAYHHIHTQYGDVKYVGIVMKYEDCINIKRRLGRIALSRKIDF